MAGGLDLRHVLASEKAWQCFWVGP